MGKRLYENQMRAASCSSRWICLSCEHPAFHPRPMYYNVQPRGWLSLLQAILQAVCGVLLSVPPEATLCLTKIDQVILPVALAPVHLRGTKRKLDPKIQ